MALIILFIVAGIFLYKGTCIVDRKLQKITTTALSLINRKQKKKKKQLKQQLSNSMVQTLRFRFCFTGSRKKAKTSATVY